MPVNAYPQQVRVDATALIVFTGPPGRSVTWSLSGTGTLTAITSSTDAQGRAYAQYTPGDIGSTPQVSATYGA